MYSFFCCRENLYVKGTRYTNTLTAPPAQSADDDSWCVFLKHLFYYFITYHFLTYSRTDAVHHNVHVYSHVWQLLPHWSLLHIFDHIHSRMLHLHSSQSKGCWCSNMQLGNLTIFGNLCCRNYHQEGSRVCEGQSKPQAHFCEYNIVPILQNWLSKKITVLINTCFFIKD
jgi:hypothetical protein